MRIQTTETTLYKFSELNPEAQAYAIEKRSELEGQDFDHEYVYEDAERIGAILGIEIGSRPYQTMGGQTLYSPDIYYSGFWSQGDGANFVGTYTYKPTAVAELQTEINGTDETLNSIALRLQKLQEGFSEETPIIATIERRSSHYEHSGRMYVSGLDDLFDYDALEYNSTEYKELVAVHARIEEELTDLMCEFADWIYESLKAEYEYRTSEEAVRENLTGLDDEYEYTANGKRQ